jgi:7-cyano-7-deazaguanine reductase
MSTTAATTPAASHVLRRRLAGRPFELWLFDANLFSFQGAAGTTASNNLPPQRCGEEAQTPLAQYPIRCGFGVKGPTSRKKREKWGTRTLYAARIYNERMSKPRYTAEHAAAGLDAKFPEIETWPNQFPGYEIVIDDPEFTSVCPKTGLPDFGVITLRYQPDKLCLELKSYKEYLQSYRNLGIFQENIVNRVLEDVVRWAKPVWAEVKGDFRPRGGISTTVVAKWPRAKGRRP